MIIIVIITIITPRFCSLLKAELQTLLDETNYSIITYLSKITSMRFSYK